MSITIPVNLCVCLLVSLCSLSTFSSNKLPCTVCLSTFNISTLCINIVDLSDEEKVSKTTLIIIAVSICSGITIMVLIALILLRTRKRPRSGHLFYLRSSHRPSIVGMMKKKDLQLISFVRFFFNVRPPNWRLVQMPEKQSNEIQWRIQHFPQTGAPTPNLVLFCKFLPKTAWKWKNSDHPKGGIPGSPLHPPMINRLYIFY